MEFCNVIPGILLGIFVGFVGTKTYFKYLKDKKIKEDQKYKEELKEADFKNAVYELRSEFKLLKEVVAKEYPTFMEAFEKAKKHRRSFMGLEMAAESLRRSYRN